MSIYTWKSYSWIGYEINEGVFTHGNCVAGLVARLKYEHLHIETVLLDWLRDQNMSIYTRKSSC